MKHSRHPYICLFPACHMALSMSIGKIIKVSASRVGGVLATVMLCFKYFILVVCRVKAFCTFNSPSRLCSYCCDWAQM